MTNKEYGIAGFISLLFAGGTFGLGWYISKKRTEKICKEQLEREVTETRNSLREYYRGEQKVQNDIPETKPQSTKKEEIKPASNVEKNTIKKMEPIKPTNYNSNNIPKITPEEIEEAKYVYIEPDEIDEHGEFGATTLYYYADGVLADRDGNVVKDIEGTIGDLDMLQTFKYSDTDEICIRNYIVNKDFQVLLCDKDFPYNGSPEDE